MVEMVYQGTTDEGYEYKCPTCEKIKYIFHTAIKEPECDCNEPPLYRNIGNPDVLMKKFLSCAEFGYNSREHGLSLEETKIKLQKILRGEK